MKYIKCPNKIKYISRFHKMTVMKLNSIIFHLNSIQLTFKQNKPIYLKY